MEEWGAPEPTEHRAVGPLIALERGLDGLLALLDETERRGVPFRAASSALDGVLRTLPLVHAALARATVERVVTVALPDDVWSVVFEFFIRRRPASVWLPTPGGGVRASATMPLVARVYDDRNRDEPSLPTLRLVCRRWARVAGQLATTLSVPPRRAEPVSLVEAFPYASEIQLAVLFETKEHREQFDAVLQGFVAHAPLLSFTDMRHVVRPGGYFAPVDVRGLFISRSGLDGDTYLNPGLTTSAWPCYHDRRKLFASLSCMCTPEHAAAALARADCVEFDALEEPLPDDRLFRAGAICFRLPFDVADEIKEGALRDLLRPARWEGERLPAVHATSYPEDADERFFANIAAFAAMVAPIVPCVFTTHVEALAAVYPNVRFLEEYNRLVG